MSQTTHKFILQLGSLAVDTNMIGFKGYTNTIEQREDDLPGNTKQYIDVVATESNKARASQLLYYHVGKVDRHFFDVSYPETNVVYFIPKEIMFSALIHRITKEEQ